MLTLSMVSSFSPARFSASKSGNEYIDQVSVNVITGWAEIYQIVVPITLVRLRMRFFHFPASSNITIDFIPSHADSPCDKYQLDG